MPNSNAITNETIRTSYQVLGILAVCEAACGAVRTSHVGEDVGNIGVALQAARRLAGEVLDVVETQALAAARRLPPASDPIFTAFAKMDVLSEALDAAAERDGFNASDSPAVKAWEEAAIEAASTAPTTKAGLVALLERLAADIDKGESCWQRQAACTAGVAVNTLMDGGGNG